MSRAVLVEADGGSRGNPGPAGCGAVVKDASSDEVLAERAVPLGVATNNFAEYSGLIAGLEAAAELEAGVVDVRMDSKLVVEQMSGRWKIKHETLRPLAQRARDIARAFERIDYQWIPRGQNSHADRLANVAMDEQAGVDTLHEDRPEAMAGSTPDSVPEVSASASAPAAAAPTRWLGAAGEPTRLLLLRHGPTELSVERRYSGRGDIALSELGVEQAAAAAKRIAAMDELSSGPLPAPVVTSPLARAKSTARAVADACGSTVSVRDGLTETDFGQWEGLSFTEAAERDPELHKRWLGDSSLAPPDGESFDAVHERVRETLDELLAEFAGNTVLVVSHVTPIKSLLRMALDAGPGLLYRLHLDLTSLSMVEFYPDGNASVRLVNDTCHLR